MPRGGHNRVPPTELLDELQRLATKLGQTPTLEDMNNEGAYSSTPYYDRFGSWNAAIEEADLDINRLSPTELKEQRRVKVSCAVCETKFTVKRSKYESQDQFCCSRACENKRRETAYKGSGNPRWRPKMVECHVCGDEFRKAKWDADRYDRHYCADCWGNTSVEIECEQCGSTKKVRRASGQRFCSYDCMGKWRASTRTGENHPRWTGGYKRYYGPNWREQHRRVRERDDYTCQECGVTEDELGEELHVHHVEPFRAFIDDGEADYGAANELGNLVSLCHSCHLRVEWDSTDARRH